MKYVVYHPSSLRTYDTLASATSAARALKKRLIVASVTDIVTVEPPIEPLELRKT